MAIRFTQRVRTYEPSEKDKRGSHTKADLIANATKRQPHWTVQIGYMPDINTCNNCGSTNFIINNDSEYVCTSCGTCSNNRVSCNNYTFSGISNMGNGVLHRGSTYTDCDSYGAGKPTRYRNPRKGGYYLRSPSSAEYNRCNHVSERLKLASNQDPRICYQHLQLIREVCIALTRDVYQIPIEECTRHILRNCLQYIDKYPNIDNDEVYNAIAQIIENYDYVVEDRYDEKSKRSSTKFTKKYAERWLQIKIFVVGGLDEWHKLKLPEILPIDTVVQMNELFKHVNFAFNKLYPNASTRHNILNLDTVFLHLLKAISQETYNKYNWYFMPLKGIKPKILTEQRIKRIWNFLARRFGRKSIWNYDTLLNKQEQSIARKKFNFSTANPYKFGLRY